MSQKKLKRERAANREKMKKEIQEKKAAKEKKEELNIENNVVEETNIVVDIPKEEITSMPEPGEQKEKKDKKENKEKAKESITIKVEEEKKIEVPEIYKIEFESLDEAEEYKRVARGREFCKIGCRIQDILEEEIENFKYENEKSVWNRIFKYREVRKRLKLARKMNLIEDRKTSNIRKVLYSVLRSDEKYKSSLDANKVLRKAKRELLEQVREYKNKNIIKDSK